MPNTRAARLSVAYRATARNVHASACPEILALTNNRKPIRFKVISFQNAFKSQKWEMTPLVTRGKSTPIPQIGA